MALRNSTNIVAFDADAAMEAAREVAGDALRTAVEYDQESYNVLFVDDTVQSLYADKEDMYDHFDAISSYVHLDFAERDLFEESLLPAAGAVQALVTRMEYLTLVRIFVGDEGLFLSLDPDTPVIEVIDAVKTSVTGPTTE